MKQITEEEAKYCPDVISIDGKEGYYTEAPSMLDKYERRDCSRNQHLSCLTYAQFCMKYSSTNAEPNDNDLKSCIEFKNEEDTTVTDDHDIIITHDFSIKKESYSLPRFISLLNLKPGEPKFMKKRRKRVIRIHKFNSTTQPHEYRFSQLQLYYPFKKEEDLGPDNFETCDQL